MMSLSRELMRVDVQMEKADAEIEALRSAKGRFKSLL